MMNNEVYFCGLIVESKTTSRNPLYALSSSLSLSPRHSWSGERTKKPLNSSSALLYDLGGNWKPENAARS